MNNNPNAMLQVIEGLPTQSPLFVVDTHVTFGNSSAADVQLNNPFISRRHFQIRYDLERYYISDLKSKNGTYVNDMQLNEQIELVLYDGDIISLSGGVVRLKFRNTGDETLTAVHIPKSLESEIFIDFGPQDVSVRGKILKPPLAPKEFLVLSILFKKIGTVVSKDDIASYGWPEREDGDVGNQEIEQCVRRIRRKIEVDPYKPKLLLTRKKMGYILDSRPSI